MRQIWRAQCDANFTPPPARALARAAEIETCHWETIAVFPFSTREDLIRATVAEDYMLERPGGANSGVARPTMAICISCDA